MKRATANHPKVQQLMHMLEVSRATAIGTLSLLWDVVAIEWHDDGGVGRWSNGTLAMALDWKGDADHLVRSLVACGFLDEVKEPERLVIHDWLAHCPNHVWDRVKKRVRRWEGRESTEAGHVRVPAWLVKMHDRAKIERSRDGVDPADEQRPGVRLDDHTAPAGSRDRSRRSTAGQSDRVANSPAPPEVSGDVRQRPATAPPNPRPKTLDPRPVTKEDSACAESCGEASGDTSPPPPPGKFGQVVMGFPVVGKPGPTWALTAAQLEAWSVAYPALEIEAECRQALAWVQASPERKKTARGMAKFLNGWLSRSQNNPAKRARSGSDYAASAAVGVSDPGQVAVRAVRELRERRKAAESVGAA